MTTVLVAAAGVAIALGCARAGATAHEAGSALSGASRAVSASATPVRPPAGSAIGRKRKSPLRAFDASAAMVHVRALASGIGVRQAGSGPERRAAAYIAGRLESWGYDADIRTFPLPKGRTSQNVVATLKGASARTIILGAHYDTKRPSPGANDNGTGTAALLEIARDLRDRRPDVTIRLVFFGSEERVDSDSDHHHFGSRAYVASMTRAERARTIGMVSIDMIGFGPDLHVRTMGRGPQTLRRKLLAFAGSIGTKITYKADTASTGSSDHEAFERAGIPAAWIEWRDDPVYHTSRDVASHVSAVKMRTVGRFVLAYVRSL